MRLCVECGRALGDSITSCCEKETVEVDREAYNMAVYRIVKRAGELADTTKPSLIDEFGKEDTHYGRQQECIGFTKGDLVEAILIDEFLEELL